MGAKYDRDPEGDDLGWWRMLILGVAVCVTFYAGVFVVAMLTRGCAS